MKNIKNQYNKEALATYKRLAEIGMKCAYNMPRDIACRPLTLGEMGRHGLVRMHIRPKTTAFMDETRVCKTFMSEMFSIADDVFFSQTENKGEILITFSVLNVVENFDERYAEKERTWYKTFEEVEAIE